MKLRYFIVVLVFLALGSNSFAQEFRLGGKVGVGGNWITGSLVDRGTRVIPHTGINGGLTAEMVFDGNISVAAEILYSGKGYTDITDYVKPEDLTKTSFLYGVNCGYLQIPVLFGYSVDNENKLTLFLGPELGFALHASQYDIIDGKKHGNADVKTWFAPFNLALALQARYMFLENLGVEVKFDWGLTRTLKDEAIDGLFIRNNTHNMGVQIGFVFNFEI